MKHILLSTLLMLCIDTSKAQVGSVPNGSFEQWHTVGGMYDEPDFWTANNTPTFSGVVKDNNHVDGLYSMQVKQGGIATSNKIRIGGYAWKFDYWVNMKSHDEVIVQTLLFQKGQLIDSPKLTLATVLYSWASGGFWFQKSADSMTIIVTGGRDSSTIINIDRIEFLTLKVEAISGPMKAQIFPNPFHQCATFRFDNPDHESYRWILNDNIGRLVMRYDHVMNENILIQREGLSPGTYFWQLRSEKNGDGAIGKFTVE